MINILYIICCLSSITLIKLSSMSVCPYVSQTIICVCMFVCMHVCMYVCMYLSVSLSYFSVAVVKYHDHGSL